jgi:cytochrome c
LFAVHFTSIYEDIKMKRFIAASMIAASMMIVGSAMAADAPAEAAKMPEIATKSGCVSCHAIDKKMVGPALMDIAKKYKGDATAAAKLDAVIAKGGSGVWGTMPMPANSKLTDAERKELVDFVLGLAK